MVGLSEYMTEEVKVEGVGDGEVETIVRVTMEQLMQMLDEWVETAREYDGD